MSGRDQEVRGGASDAHHVHVWALDSRRTALSAHLVVEDREDRDRVLAGYRSELSERSGVDHATVQVESADFAETVELECYPATGG